MMKTCFMLPLAVMLILLFTVPALAANDAAVPGQSDPQQGTQATTEGKNAGTVSPAQVETVRKREQARKRRDEMMKLRQQNIKLMSRGNPPVEKTPTQ
jgi:hypothetical protein